MGALTEQKIDCHNHILDPERYPYWLETRYRPSGQEIGTEQQLHMVCDTYNVNHCLVVGPNSGYDLGSGPINLCYLTRVILVAYKVEARWKPSGFQGLTLKEAGKRTALPLSDIL